VILRLETSGISSAARLALLLAALAAAAHAQTGTLTITSGPTLPTGSVGVPYSVTLNATGGCAPDDYTWSFSDESQQAFGWLHLSTGGVLTGTPVTPPLGTQYTFTVMAGDDCAFGQKTLTIPLGPPAPTLQITPANPPAGEVNQSYSYQFSATGATGVSWSLQSAPSWLTISSSTGVISGTPTTAGTAALTVIATAGQASASMAASFTVYPALVVQASTLPPGIVNIPYSQRLVFSGGSSQSYTVSATGLPAGLSLANSGILSGTPTSAGAFNLSVSVKDSAGFAASGNFALTIFPALSIISTSLPPGTVGVTYSQSFSASGGSGGYSWSASGVPQGLSVNAGGQISGTPGTAGSFPLNLTVRDSADNTATASVTLTIAAPALSITSASLAPATVGLPYSQSLSASGGSGKYNWSVSGLPQGLTVDTGGLISGTPGAAGSFPLNLTVRDSSENTATATVTLQVNPSFRITTTSLESGTLGTPYSANLSASGNVGTVVWSRTGGALPDGLALASDGSIAGTPKATGDFTFTVQAVDSTNSPVSASFSIHVALPPPSTLMASLPSVLTPGSQPTVTIDVSPAYPLPLTATATLSISPDLNGGTDLGFTNGSRTIQFTIPANSTQYQLPFSAGTSAGTITVTLSVDTTGQAIVVSGSLVLTGQVSPGAPSIRDVTATASTTGSTLSVVVTGFSSTRDMKTAAFHFTPAAGASLTATDFSLDVSSLFTAWYANPASFVTGSQFKLTVPFTIVGNPATIASVTVTLTNSAATSNPITATVH